MLGILPTFSASAVVFRRFNDGVKSVFKTSGLIRVKPSFTNVLYSFVSTIPVFSKIISKLLLSNQVGSVARWERVVLSLDKFSESLRYGSRSSTFGVSPNNIYASRKKSAFLFSFIFAVILGSFIWTKPVLDLFKL